MKNKLLTTTLLISLATPVVAIASSNISTNVTNNSTAATKASGPLNAITSRKITFKAKDSQTGVTWQGKTIVKAYDGDTFASVVKPVAYKDERPQTYWVDENGTRIADDAIISADMVVYPYFQADIQLANCLSVIALEHTKFNVVHYGNHNPDLQYSSDGYNWLRFTGNTVDILPGSAIYIRGNNPTGFNKSDTEYTSFTMAGSVHLNGSAMSLIDDGSGTATAIPTNNTFCFGRLFEGCSGIKVISSAFLPASTLQPHCYDSMFKDCTNLVKFPEYLLKAKKLSDYCYANMFSGCTNLVTIPEGLLQYATTLSDHCYFQMFKDCTGITTLPGGTLPADTVPLKPYCYAGMFRGCSELTTLGDSLLPNITMSDYCYYAMFESCTKLNNLPANLLPAGITTGGSLAPYCYKSMFVNCTSLTQSPTLSSTVTNSLAEGCYYSMFYNCTALTSCPALNAASLATKCYAYMFYNCTTIKETSYNQNASLADYCYDSMFYNCTSLTTAHDINALTWPQYCFNSMFFNCTGLTTPPALGGTTGTISLGEYCCQRMFSRTAITKTPALRATTAGVGCYRYMFDSCTGLVNSTTGAIGYVSLSTLAEYSCYMMFARCSNIQIYTSSTSHTKFFQCPSYDIMPTEAVTSMFQETKNAEGGNPAKSKQSYYY